MTKHNAKYGEAMCKLCQHDLHVKSDGLVYCSNRTCKFAKQPHPAGAKRNEGR